MTPSGDAPSAAAAGKSTEVEHDPVVIKATFDWGYKKEHAEIRASEMGWLDRSRLQPAAAREADPVAYRISQGAGWNYYDTLNERQLTRFKELGWFIEPLYASPVPSSSERDDIIEMCAKVVDEYSQIGMWTASETRQAIASTIRSLKSQPAQEEGRRRPHPDCRYCAGLGTIADSSGERPCPCTNRPAQESGEGSP
jgi:hypothetical protein